MPSHYGDNIVENISYAVAFRIVQQIRGIAFGGSIMYLPMYHLLQEIYFDLGKQMGSAKQKLTKTVQFNAQHYIVYFQ
jgi:hypothetical protein